MFGFYGTRLIVVAAMLTLPVEKASSQPVSFEPPPGSELMAAIGQLPADQKDAVTAVAKDVFPVFVFVPGVMGSRLFKKTATGEKIIWGNFEGPFAAADKNLEYNEQDDVRAEVMDEFYLRPALVDVYGKAINTLTFIDLSKGKGVYKFPYDWRQSNAKSARDFAKWMCVNKTRFDGRPIVILAHSMGGLVVKSWLKDIYETDGCDGGEKFSSWATIKRIIFLGTPFYGAPKAVTAFADDYSVLFDRDDSIWISILSALDILTVSKSINAFGATFPSAYELLPIVNASDCFQEGDWPSDVSVKMRIGVSHTNVDLFDIKTWQALNWPKNLDKSIDRKDFIARRLPVLLQSAQDFLCPLARYRPDAKYEVVRFAGFDRKTICKVAINQPESPVATATVTTELCNEGDGTVPKWIASDDKQIKADFTHDLAEGHSKLAGNDGFVRYMINYNKELHQNVQRTYFKRFGNVDGLVKTYLATRTIFPGSGLPDDPTVQTARAVLAGLGLQPDDIYTAAKSETRPSARANAYELFASTAAPNDPKRPWAFNNAASINLSRKDPAAAFELGRRALLAAQESNNLNDIRFKAASNAALAAELLKNRDTAVALRGVAVGRVELSDIPDFVLVQGTVQ